MRRIPLLALATSLTLAASTAWAQVPMAKHFDPPPKTDWEPEGCRAVPATNDVLPARTSFRILHSDTVNSDEISSALTPVFEADWTAEADRFAASGAVFDSAGNVYMSPFRPYDDVRIISLNAEDGSQRWELSTASLAAVGGSTPLVLADPDSPGDEIVYVGLYDKVLAVRTDGTLVYEAPTGLVAVGNSEELVVGLNYLPQTDSLVGLAADGSIYAVDRATGAQALGSVFQLPGEKSPPGAPIALPPPVLAAVEAIFTSFVKLPANLSFLDFVDRLLGNQIEVANMFSIDPNSGRLWVAATAPDAEDGVVDGQSEFGALYGLDLVPNGANFDVVEACHVSFPGGSASTPALRQDGTRVYFGDNAGVLLAVDQSCNVEWTLDVGSQIVGSVAVSSDNNELYLATLTSIVQAFDNGASGSFGWTANLDVFDVPPGQVNFNLLLAGIGANGVNFHAGAGPIIGLPLPLRTGVGVLDRDTGEVRYFAEGPEESLAANTTGPDGAIYLGNSPFRRIVSRVLFGAATPPITGGITKYAGQRLDLLIRDAACAGEDRAQNAFDNRMLCPDSATADLTQIQELIDQARTAAPAAVQAGDLSAEQWAGLDKEFKKAERKLLPSKLQHLQPAANALGRACSIFE